MHKLLYALLAGAILARLSPVAALAEPGSEPPPQSHLTEKKLSELSFVAVDPLGAKVLAIAPGKWKHAETDNFIVHYRRVTEAQRAIREIEYDLWFVAKSLGATKERYATKSQVFIFEDEREWRQFLVDTGRPQWVGSFALRDELFLHIGGAGEGFDSHMLAHETTHAAVARLYPGCRWPVWLSEGFAEYMGSASIAARKSQFIKSLESNLQHADLPLEKLTAISEYPIAPEAVAQLYQSGEKLVRFLMTAFPKDRFVPFIDAITSGRTLEEAVVQIYGDKLKDYASFKTQYDRFQK
jgi:hypothetical protein